MNSPYVQSDIPATHEQLAILVSKGKAKEAIGVHLTQDQVRRLEEKDVERCYKRYELMVVNTALITPKHINFSPFVAEPSRPSCDADGYPIEVLISANAE